MFPLKDDNPTQTAPVFTVLLIVANALVYFYQFSLEVGGPAGAKAGQAFIGEFGLVPCRLVGSCPVTADLPSPILTIFTSMFMHGSLFHIGGNMLYLWIFGNNVEDTLGHVRFVIFYLASGVAAALAQTVVGPDSTVPMVGASGAISGVLGAYIVFEPRNRILTLIFIFLVRVPAVIVLGVWFGLQFLSGLSELGSHVNGGVAVWAHIGGFLIGVLVAILVKRH